MLDELKNCLSENAVSVVSASRSPIGTAAWLVPIQTLAVPTGPVEELSSFSSASLKLHQSTNNKNGASYEPGVGAPLEVWEREPPHPQNEE